jgi:hypothetical protein
MGEEVLAGGDGDRAADIFAQIIEIAPDSAPAHSGLIRALLLAGRKDEAAEVLAALDPRLADDPRWRRPARRWRWRRTRPRPANWPACAPRRRPIRRTWTRSSPMPTRSMPVAIAMPPPPRCCA